MNMTIEEEVEFLRDQVYRLNSVLAEYQSKYPTLLSPRHGDSSETTGLYPVEGKNPKWLTDKRLMTPLLTEYDAQIKNLTKQVKTHHDEQNRLGKQLDTLINENQRLTRDLKEQVQLQLDALNNRSGVENQDVNTSGTGMKYQEVVDNLQEQLMIALQEKDSATNLLHEAISKLDRMKAMHDQRFHPQFRTFEQHLSQIKENYGRYFAQQSTELNRYKLQLSEKEQNLQAIEESNASLRKQLDLFQTQADLKNNQFSATEVETMNLKSYSEDLEQMIQTLKDRIDRIEKENRSLLTDRETLIQQSSSLQEKANHLEANHASGLQQLKANVQMIENAILEKDQAVIKEKQLTDVVNQLKASLEELVLEAGIQTKREVEEIRMECANKLKKMSDHISEVEEELRSKTRELERAKREADEKRNDLNAHDSRFCSLSCNSAEFDALREQKHEVEMNRDKLKVESEQLKKEQKSRIKSHDLANKAWKEKDEKQNASIWDLITEADQARADKGEMAGEKDKLLGVVARLKAEQRDFENRIMIQENAHIEAANEKQEYAQAKMRALEETHEKNISEMRITMVKHKKLQTDLQREMQTTTKEYESNSICMKQQNCAAKQKIADLTVELRQQRGSVEDLEKRVDRTEHQLKTTEGKLTTVERNRSDVNMMLIQKIEEQKDHLLTIRKLEKEIEKASISNGRLMFTRSDKENILNESSSTVAPDFVKSDVTSDLKKFFGETVVEKKKKLKRISSQSTSDSPSKHSFGERKSQK